MAFKLNAIDQMKTFMLAGTSTTSSTISYIYYLLDLHPYSLAKVRKEYDNILGDDRTATAEVISRDPHLMNKLVYTTAVIKGKSHHVLHQLMYYHIARHYYIFNQIASSLY